MSKIVFILIEISLNFLLCRGQYFGTYDVQIENGNTGRIYAAEKNSLGVGDYGTVCVG